MKFTADEVEQLMQGNTDDRVCDVLFEFARRIRAEESEANRDVINDPMPGDCIYIMSNPLVYIEEPEETGADYLSGGCTCCDFWKDAATHPGAIVVPRREVAK